VKYNFEEVDLFRLFHVNALIFVIAQEIEDEMVLSFLLETCLTGTAHVGIRLDVVI